LNFIYATFFERKNPLNLATKLDEIWLLSSIIKPILHLFSIFVVRYHESMALLTIIR
jgi:hypothetical protein